MATAKISVKSEQILEKIRQDSGDTKVAIIEKALKELDKKLAIEKLNQAYLRLKKDKAGWAEEMKEREELEGTLEDGLSDEEF